MFDMDALLLAPTYAAWAIAAEFTLKDGSTRTVSILDHRDGTNITAVRGYSGATTVLPRAINVEEAVILMRQSEVPEKPTGWTVTLPADGGDRTYRISSSAQKGRPGSGEWACVLKEA
jgi:hypothetical protein